MPSIITTLGEKLFAQKAQANQQLDIDTFIFANVPGQDPSAEIDRNETVPISAQQVHTQIVQQVGRINDNVVVYSTVLDSVTGAFDFNWVGLYSSVNNTLVAINHIPTTTKTITEPGIAGNTLNRNFGIEYSGIAELTGINVAPETWQLDFTARLSGMDELTRQLARDMNGRDWFINNGFKVVPRVTLNTFDVLPGAGYVNGLRIDQENVNILTLTTYPQFVYVDAYFDGDASSIWKPQHTFITSDTELNDYVDVNGKEHFVLKLATISAADTVEDLRSNEGVLVKVNEHIEKGKHKANDIELDEGSDVQQKFNDLSAEQIKTSDSRSVQKRLDDLPQEVDAAGTAAQLINSHNAEHSVHPEMSSFITFEADRASAAADAASLIGNVYETVDEGVTNTTDGKYFSVVGESNNFLSLFKKDGPVATKIKDYPAMKKGMLHNDSLEFLRPINVFKVGTEIEGGFFSSSDGSWNENALFYSTNRINIEAGDSIEFTRNELKAVAFYDINGRFISGEDATEIVAPLNAETFTLAMRSSEYLPSELMIVLNISLPYEYIPYSKKRLNADTDIELTSKKNENSGYVGLDENKKAKADFIDCFDQTENLLNISKIIDNGYYGTSGMWTDDNGFFSTPFLPVEENESYASNDAGAKIWTWYDKNKTPISAAVSASPQVAPANAEFLTKSYSYGVDDDKSMVVKGATAPTSFVAFGYKPNVLLLPSDSESGAANPLKGKVIAGLGDSITFGYIPRNYTGYPGQLESYLPKIAAKFGASYENYGISGTSVSSSSNQPVNSFVSRYNSMRDDADLIIVMGGTNDIRTEVPLGEFGDTTTGTYYGDLFIICEGLLNKYRYNQGITIGAQKKIMFMTALRLGTSLNTTLPLFNQAVIKTCNHFGLPVFDAYNLSGITPELFKTVQGTEPGYTEIYNPFITDGTHPTDEGNEIFSKALHGFIKNLY
jgi:lysophospholipase L1-like esterase